MKLPYLGFVSFHFQILHLAFHGFHLSSWKSDVLKSSIFALEATGNLNTLSAIKINVVLFTCVPAPVFFESFRKDLIEAKAVIKLRVTSLSINC